MIQIDIKMPNSCAECKFSYVDVCPLQDKSVVKNVINNKRDKNCPLMEINKNQIELIPYMIGIKIMENKELEKQIENNKKTIENLNQCMIKLEREK